MATRSDYIAVIKEHRGYKVLSIIDYNLGRMSVTNDIENVVAEIAQAEQINPADHLIIYRDSEKVWDGWDHITQSFIPLQQTTETAAMDKIADYVEAKAESEQNSLENQPTEQ